MNNELSKAPAGSTASAYVDTSAGVANPANIAEHELLDAFSIPENPPICNDPHDLFVNIPDEIKAHKNWVYTEGDKLPKTPFGGMAKSNDLSTWGTFEDAKECASICYGWCIGYGGIADRV